MQTRRLVMLLLVPCYGLFVVLVGTGALAALVSDDWGGFWEDFFDLLIDPGYWLFALIAGGVIIGSQALFLIPAIRFRRGRREKGKPLLLSAGLLALIAAVLITGFACAIFELAWPWNSVDRPSADEFSRSEDLMDQGWFGWMFLCLLGASWIVWSAIIWRAAQRRRMPESILGRFINWILAATIIEALIVLPIDVMVRRRTDCYCATGTFIALSFAIIGVLWLSGPGLFIALTAKRRRPWYQMHCSECGYAKGPSPGGCCPECGYNWAVAPPQSIAR